MNSVLIMDKVNKRYAKTGFAIEDISFSLHEGSIIGLIGENGAGKSSTFACILNTIKKDSGIVRLFGIEMSDADIDLREDIGVVYDGNNFPEYLTAKQLADILKAIYRNWDNILYKDYMKRFDLPENQKIKTYSRGMSMKLAMVAALSHRPKLLLLDEATSGLDPIMRDEILDVLLEFTKQDKHSVLLSSHITGDLEKIADYIVFIHKGKVILNKMKDELIYEYGIIRCTEDDFANILPEDIVAYKKKDYQIDILISDIKTMRRKYKHFIIDNTSLDEIMLLLAKGEKNAGTDKK